MAGPTTLYLVDPLGGRYSLFRWPVGRGIVTARIPANPDSKIYRIARYNLRGQLQKVLAAGNLLPGVAYAPDGRRLAVGRLSGGIELVSNAGGLVRGYVDAWQLSSGMYLQGEEECNGRVVIARQPAHRPVQIIKVPGSSGSAIVTATRSRLLVQRNVCTGSSSLAWLNPVTGMVTVAVPAHHGDIGVVGLVPYFVQGKR